MKKSQKNEEDIKEIMNKEDKIPQNIINENQKKMFKTSVIVKNSKIKKICDFCQ